MQQPPFEQSMPMPEGQPPAEPAASQGAMSAKAQADRKATRDVPYEQLNAAMQKGAEAVAQGLYKNRQTSNAALKMINDSEKVGSTAKAVTMFLSEINKRAQLPERIMVPLAMMTADELMEMAEQSGRAQYSPEEATQVALTTAEMIMRSYGVEPERAAQLAQQASQQDLQMAESAFNQALNGGQQAPQEAPQNG